MSVNNSGIVPNTFNTRRRRNVSSSVGSQGGGDTARNVRALIGQEAYNTIANSRESVGIPRPQGPFQAVYGIRAQGPTFPRGSNNANSIRSPLGRRLRQLRNLRNAIKNSIEMQYGSVNNAPNNKKNNLRRVLEQLAETQRLYNGITRRNRN